MPHVIECQRRRYWNPNLLCDCNPEEEEPIQPLPVDLEVIYRELYQKQSQQQNLESATNQTHEH